MEKNENGSEYDIIDHPTVFFWLKDLAKNDPLAFVVLTENNLERFNKVFGKPHGTTQKFKFWKKEHLGITIFLYTNKEASFYKVQYIGDNQAFSQDKKIGAYITGFLNKLLKDLLNA